MSQSSLEHQALKAWASAMKVTTTSFGNFFPTEHTSLLVVRGEIKGWIHGIAPLFKISVGKDTRKKTVVKHTVRR